MLMGKLQNRHLVKALVGLLGLEIGLVSLSADHSSDGLVKLLCCCFV